MKTSAPTNKVSIGVAVGAMVVIASWMVGEGAGMSIPAHVVAAAQTVAVFIAQWATSDG